MMENTLKIIEANSPLFKKLVIDYGHKNIGKKFTYEFFLKWIRERGFELYKYDKYWRGIFVSVLQHEFTVNVSYKKNNFNLITFFKIYKIGKSSVLYNSNEGDFMI